MARSPRMNREALLETLQSAVRALEADLEQRVEADSELAEAVTRQYRAAKQAGRTAEAEADFREALVTQAAVAWVLACVFVRFLEDGGFLDGGRADGGSAGRLRWLGGADEADLRLARDHECAYFRDHPRHGEREYLLHVFRTVEALPGMGPLFDEAHNPLWTITPSADGARDLLETFRAADPETGEPRHPFVARRDDGTLDTRFLGDLYQDLSEAARKRYALLQTPEFVEEFILDLTLTPAIETFGHGAVTVIDPACGSGHFLLGAFGRLLELARRDRPGDGVRTLVQDVLDRVAGVDLNPFAAAIARFRLLVAAIDACDIGRLVEAPGFRVKVAAGDSLLHGRRPEKLFDPQDTLAGFEDPYEHFYLAEDPELLREILGHPYHVVVGNPPYITVRDKGLNGLYRERFDSCYRQYSLVCPFLERFFDLARRPVGDDPSTAGFVGAIVANSFMKREFGKRLIQDILPRWDLTHVVDTSGAYIPGHGTPTVILAGRQRAPVADEVRAVLGIRGEPETPVDPARGEVWTEILELIGQPGGEGEYVSTADAPRRRFVEHPWSLQGGGAAALRDRMDAGSSARLDDIVEAVGFYQDTHADEAFVQPAAFPERHGIEVAFRPQIRGEGVRDWGAVSNEAILFPYDENLEQWKRFPVDGRWIWLWRLRTKLWSRSTFGGGTYRSAGRPWYDWHQFPKDRARTPLSIAFAFVATHNHFVLDRGGKVFNRSAPVIKLPPEATEENHLGLLGLLNSSAGCFWMKQVFHDKGVGGIGGGIGDEAWEPRYEHDGTKTKLFPVPPKRPLALARHLDELARKTSRSLPGQVFHDRGSRPDRQRLNAARRTWEFEHHRMIALQEELDWQVYALYGLTDEPLTLPDPASAQPLELGQRAFEIVLARQLAAGELKTTWFERHGSTPITDLPSHWPDDYRALVERRIALIESDKNIGLIERPEYKRRWNTEPWEAMEERALRSHLLDRLEAEALWSRERPELLSAARLADLVARDEAFRSAAALYRGREDYDLTKLVTELASAEAVPYLASQRYKPSGLKKRARWERTWELQRAEAALDARVELPENDPQRLTPKQAEKRKREEIGEIPVPPKYKSADFRSSTIWSHRGKLDVPKERFVAYPGAEREADPTPVFGWAGWTALERMKALATYTLERKDREGWPQERLLPLLAGLAELLPWVKQWHNDFDPTAGMGLGDYFAGFLAEEARGLGVTVEELERWER